MLTFFLCILKLDTNTNTNTNTNIESVLIGVKGIVIRLKDSVTYTPS